MDIVWFIVGLVVGSLVVWLVMRARATITRTVLEARIKAGEEAQQKLSETFDSLAAKALQNNNQSFLQLANETLSKQTQTGVGELEGKKKLIDQTLESIKSDLQKVERLITDSESKREKVFGEVSTQLKLTGEQTGKLQETTNKLQAALANTKTRGQWGERMAEDVLRFAGLVEGINYLKQKTQEETTTRPDYTFLLPGDLKINMDVKFPLDNYMKYFNEESETSRETYKQQFLKDARRRIKEVTTRDYINPNNNTVDYCLVFIPSEQVYCFINENDNNFVDEAIKNKVIMCSPLTLYAMLAVIRQAVDNFNMERTASRILALFGEFNKQWVAFKESMEKMGKRIGDASEEYQKLTSTRTDKLERPLREIEDLRKQKGILESSLLTGETTAEKPPESGEKRE